MLALALRLASGSARADEPFAAGPFGVLPKPLADFLRAVDFTPWIAGLILLATLALWAFDRLRKRRRGVRQRILDLGGGARFRVVDAMCHAVWRGRAMDQNRLTRALEIARSTTDRAYTIDHIRETADRADRLILPMNFNWMRDGLTTREKMVVVNAAVSVLLADGPLTTTDRRFAAILVRGLGLSRHDLRDLARLMPA
ncbi:MAG: hypothetical protein AAF919_06730 [Pseudomonadota bacterium]